jgi:hypothetical protein
MRAKLASLPLAAVALLACWPLRAAGVDSVALSTLLVSIAPIFVLFGLLSIWLSAYFSAFAGPLFRGGYVNSPTPEAAFIWFGYFLLAVPLLAVSYHVIAHGTRTI